MAAENSTVFDFAALARAATTTDRLPVHAAPAGAPIDASPEITAAVAAYWTGVAEANAGGASDDLISLKCEEMDAAAAQVAAAPCRGLADLAAKIVFFVDVMNHENGWGSVTTAEGDVLVSVEAGVLALLSGRSA